MKYIIFIAVAVLIIWGAAMYRPVSTEVTAGKPAVEEEVATNTGTIVPTNTINKPTANTMPNGLKIEDVKVGTGAEAKSGDLVTVHYVGTLTDGKKFDSSRDRGEPFQFPLGQSYVIKGWDLGVAGMKVGGVRKLTIPPDLGYGAAGAGASIPPNATLHFEVELLAVRSN